MKQVLNFCNCQHVLCRDQLLPELRSRDLWRDLSFLLWPSSVNTNEEHVNADPEGSSPRMQFFWESSPRAWWGDTRVPAFPAPHTGASICIHRRPEDMQAGNQDVCVLICVLPLITSNLKRVIHLPLTLIFKYMETELHGLHGFFSL